MLNRQTLLIVEDNPDDAELARQAILLSEATTHVIFKPDGESALDYLLSTENHLPTVVLLDLHLPALSGTDVLRVLRENPRTRFLPVVVLSTSREPTDLRESYETGANSYVVKPIDFSRFVDTVKQLVQYWLLTNEHPPEASEREGPQ